jgi:hypothetical protein
VVGGEEVMVSRICYNCGMAIIIDDFIDKARITQGLSFHEACKIWNCSYVEVLCCGCLAEEINIYPLEGKK